MILPSLKFAVGTNAALSLMGSAKNSARSIIGTQANDGYQDFPHKTTVARSAAGDQPVGKAVPSAEFGG